jgi:tol-pal system protein YbgF
MIRFRRLAPSVSLALATAAVLIVGWGAPVRAQEGPPPDEPSAKRLDRLERELREVRQIVLQAHATGQPVEIKEAGPDPQVVALQGRIDDIDSMVRRMTGELETLNHQIDGLRKDLDDSHAQAAALADRVDKLEKQAAATTAPPPPPPPPPGADTNAAAALPPSDPKTAYAHARQLLEDGDYAGAAAELQAFIDRYGSSPTVPAARYWLGEARFIQKDYPGAATAYLGAIRGWPKTSWAPEAVVKLSQSLLEIGKPQDACGALSELDRRYPHVAPALKARAAATRARAQCSG